MEVREWSRGPSGGAGVVSRLSWRTEVVRRPSRRPESGREALPKGRQWSGGPPSEPGVVGRPSRRAESGQEALLVFRE